MIKITKRERKIFWAAGAVVFLLFNYLVVWELLKSAIEKQKTLSQLKSETTLRNETIGKTDSWTAEIKSLQPPAKSEGTPGKPDGETDWLRRLETLAKKSGLSLNSQRPLGEKKTAFGTESGVNYSIETGQEALVKFLFGLQNDPANPQVQILQITPDNPSADKLRVEATIMVTRYTL